MNITYCPTELLSPRRILTTAERGYASPRKEIKNAKSEAGRLGDRIKRALARGDRRTAEYLYRTYRQSRSAKIDAVKASSDARARRGKSWVEGAALIDLAEALLVDVPSHEKITVFPKRKSAQGQFRAIHSYGLIEQARHRLVTNALRPFVKTDERQFASNGGRDAACRRVMELMPTYRFAQEVDIKDFFPNVCRDWLRQNMPTGTEKDGKTGRIFNALFPDHTDLQRYHYRGCGLSSPCLSEVSLILQAQHGLPQGAGSSSMLAEMVVAEIIKNVPDGMVIVNFADNFLCMGRTRAEAMACAEALCSAARQCPAGSLSMKMGKMRRVADGVDFLGYRLRSVRRRSEAMPMSKKLVEFRVGAAKLMRRIYHGRATSCDELSRYLAGWGAGFRLCKDIDTLICLEMAEFARRVPEVRMQIMASFQGQLGALHRRLDAVVSERAACNVLS